LCKKINRSHTHTDREQHPRHRHTHAHDKNNTPNPQTNTSHKHLTTLEGCATTVRATSHAGVGGRAEVSVRGRVEAQLEREHACVRGRGVVALRVEYAERGNEYGIILFCEYINLEYVRIYAIYRVNQAEYVIHIRMAVSQEYVNIYTTRRVVASLHRANSALTQIELDVQF